MAWEHKVMDGIHVFRCSNSFIEGTGEANVLFLCYALTNAHLANGSKISAPCFNKSGHIVVSGRKKLHNKAGSVCFYSLNANNTVNEQVKKHTWV